MWRSYGTRLPCAVTVILLLYAWPDVSMLHASQRVDTISYRSIALDRPSGIRLDTASHVTIHEDAGCLFNRIRGVVLQNDGGIVVANSGNHELCTFDSQGRLIDREGRSGEGPGEYRGLYRLNPLAGDSLLVFDNSLRRLSILDPDRSFIRSIPLTPPNDELGSVGQVAVAGDGTILVGYSEFVTGQPRPEAVQFTMAVFGYATDGQLHSDLGQFPLSEHFIQEVPRNMGGVAYWNRAFGKQTGLATTSKGFVAGDGSDFSVVEYRSDGTRIAVHRINLERSPLTAADIARYKQIQIDGASAGQRTVVEKLVAEMPYPRTYPAYRALLTDHAERIWLELYPRDESAQPHWLVFDGASRRASLLIAPADHQIMAVSPTRACGVVRNELDVEGVFCFGLQGS